MRKALIGNAILLLGMRCSSWRRQFKLRSGCTKLRKEFRSPQAPEF